MARVEAGQVESSVAAYIGSDDALQQRAIGQERPGPFSWLLSLPLLAVSLVLAELVREMLMMARVGMPFPFLLFPPHRNDHRFSPLHHPASVCHQARVGGLEPPLPGGPVPRSVTRPTRDSYCRASTVRPKFPLWEVTVLLEP